jgi:uncharacterized membrane protein
MSTGVVIALLAGAISLGTAFFAVQSNKAKKPAKSDSGESSVPMSSDSSSADCGPGDSAGGCDGGGGGGD